MKSNIDVQVIKKKAEEYYRCGEFYCSEAIVKTIKDEFELELPDQVIAMASGFPVGIGGSDVVENSGVMGSSGVVEVSETGW